MIRVVLRNPSPRFALPKWDVLARIASWRNRQALNELDDHALADIGLTRAAAEKEAARAIWNAPDHWSQ